MNELKFQNEPESGVYYEYRPGSYGFLLNSRNLVAMIKLEDGFFLPAGRTEIGEAPDPESYDRSRPAY